MSTLGQGTRCLWVSARYSCPFSAVRLGGPGRSAVHDIDASPGGYSGRSAANAGRILGIVATLMLLGVLALALFGGVPASGPNP
jgi:hypothetical protein